jgi:hypothetical protein
VKCEHVFSPALTLLPEKTPHDSIDLDEFLEVPLKISEELHPRRKKELIIYLLQEILCYSE